MANEIVGVQIKVDSSQATKSLGDIRREIKQANADLINAQSQFGNYSKQALTAAKKVATLKDSIKEAAETADLFDPGKKFGALSGAVQAVAGGFAAVQGAIGLLGVESEDVQKSILKVQSALALSQGLSTISDSAKSFARLGAEIKGPVVKAFTTLKGAIIATGLGALAVGIGLLIANFDKIKQVVLNLIPQLAAIADFVGKLVNKITDFVGATSEAGRATSKLIEDNKKAIEATERFLDLNADKFDEFDQRRMKSGLELAKKQTALREAEQKGEITAAELKLFLQQSEDKSNREIDAAEKDRILAKSALNKKAFDEQKALNDKAAQLKKEADDAEREAENQRNQRSSEAQQILIDAFRATLTEREQAELQAQDELEKKKEALIKAGNFNFESLEAEHKIKLKEINDNFNKEEDEKQIAIDDKKREADALNKTRERETLALTAVTLQQKKALELESLNAEYNEKLLLAIKNGEDIVALRTLYAAKETEINKKFTKDQKAIDEAATKAKIDNLNAVANVLGSFAALAGEQTVANKAFTLAQIGVDTASAISSLTKNSEGNPANSVTFGVAGAVQFATGLIRILANIKKAKTLLSNPKASPSASNAPAPTRSFNAPIIPQAPTASLTQLNQQSINQLGSATNRAFVVESDISNSQERITRINRAARLA